MARKHDGIPRNREEKIDRAMNWCRNYNGLVHDECKAGVNYRQLHGEDWAHTICLGESARPCPSASFPNYEEAAKAVDEREAYIKEWVRKIEAKECPHCGKTYEGRQVGSCVYCEHCEARLYNGRK